MLGDEDMKKFICLLTVIWAIVAATSAQAYKPFVIGTDEWEPYEYKQGNKTIGLSTEIVQEVFDQCNTVIESITDYPWVRGEMMLIRGDLDGLYTAAYNAERAEKVKYPNVSLVDSSWVLYSKRDKNLKYTKLEDLKGKSIGLVRGYRYTPEFMKYVEMNCQVDYVNQDILNFRKLILDRVDYVIADKYNGSIILDEQKMNDQVTIQDVTVGDIPLYFIFSSKIQDEFIHTFEEKLKTFKTTEKYRRILLKYLGR